MVDIEKLAINYLLLNPEATLEFITEGIDSSYFNNSISKSIVREILNHYKSYRQAISPIELRKSLEDIGLNKDIYEDYISMTSDEIVDISCEWVISTLTSHKKKFVMSKSVQNIVMTLNDGNIAAAEKELNKVNKQVSQLGDNRGLVVNLNDDASDITSTLNQPKNERKIRTGYKEFDTVIHGFKPGYLVVVAARPKTGKCFAKGTEVLMYDGLVKKVEDIKNGELVMGDDSTPRRVEGTTSGKEKMYKIIPNKGEPFVVNESHILSLKKSGQRLDRGLPKILNISVREYLHRAKKENLRKYKLYRSGVQFKSSRVPKYLPPYLLGLWLGDGSSKAAEITTKDSEIVTYLTKLMSKFNGKLTEQKSKSGKCPCYYLAFHDTYSRGNNYILDELRKFNLLHNKHIPHTYKINDEKVRLEVLAGLLDSDGYYDSKTYEIVTKYRALKDDIVFLGRSLGFGVTAKKVTKTIKSIGFSGKYWRIRIGGEVSRIPTIISRKKAEAKSVRCRDALKTGFKIEEVGTGEYYGFAVDKNSLFLLADFTVVHNTRSMVNLVSNMVKDKVNVLAFTLEMPKDQYVNLFFSCMTGIQYYKFEDRTLNDIEMLAVNKFQKRLKEDMGKLTIVDTLSSVNPDYIKHKIQEIEAQTGITYDVIAIDHATMMRPNQFAGSDWIDQGSIAEDLRGIGREMGKVMLTAVQLKRSGIHSNKAKKKNDMNPGDDLARSDTWFQTLDILLSIIKDEEDDGVSDLSTIKFRVINRHAMSATVELIKDFSITSIYSLDDNKFKNGVTSFWNPNSPRGDADEDKN